ncbi:hypothetical protein D3C79_671030 [compost metagenome]
MVRRQGQAAIAQPVGAADAPQQQLFGAQVMVEQAVVLTFQQPAQAVVQIMIVRIGNRYIGRQVDQPRLPFAVFEAKQGRFLAPRQHIGTAAHFTRHQVASGGFTVGLLGGTGVQAQFPGQAPLRRQAVTDLEYAALDGVAYSVDQCQIPGLVILDELRDPHEIATHAI